MEKDLRLRLVVRRHGVPDVKLLWNATTNEDLTISKLVAQINEVIPLESGEWGLEDYAVELKDASGEGFECVHYHLVSKVLKDDDQVLVRPLLTDDLKRRRLSGRHQISSDGKHLVDGLAYGRSWLKAPRDRPVVALPPRKKARIAYSSDDEYDSPAENDDVAELPMIEYNSTRAQQDPSSVRLRARFYDAESDGDDEDDDEFEPGDDEDDENVDSEDDDIEEELRLLGEDNAAVRRNQVIDEYHKIKNTAGSDTRRGRSPIASARNALVKSATQTDRPDWDMHFLDKLSALKVAFPTAPVSVIEQTLRRCDKDSAKAYRKLGRRFSTQIGLHQMLEFQERSLSSSPIRQTEPNAGQELVRRDSSPAERASFVTDGSDESEEASSTLNHNAHVDQEHEEGDLASESDSEAGSGSSSSEPDSEADQEMDDSSDEHSGDSHEAFEVISSDDSGESGDESPVQDGHSSEVTNQEKLDSDDDSNADGDASSDEADSGGSSTGHPTRNEAAVDESSSDSSSESSSESSSSEESDSDSEPEEIPTKTATNQRLGLHGRKSVLSDSSSDSSSESSSESSSSDESDSESEPKKLPTKTSADQHKAMDAFKLQLPPMTSSISRGQPFPPVPPGQGLSKTQKRNARRKLAKQMTSQGRSTPGQSSATSQTSAVDAHDEQAALLARKKALLDAIISDAPAESQGQEASTEITGSTQDSAQAQSNSPQTSTTQGDASGQRRMKPNVGAARRMLMGSLGLKNPKTKADEEKIKQDLMKGVRPHTNARLEEANLQAGESSGPQESLDEDPEAWREKITLRGVECCHDGVVLSEPPFPFVQRWDPQQQVEVWFGTNKRGGKRKRAQRNQAHFYEGGESQSSKKRRVTGDSAVTFSDAVESMEEGDTTLNYDDPVEEPEEPEVPKAPVEESQATDMEDLPSLPSDLTTLPLLQPGEAKAGMVITWKQMVLSIATNWQPEVINFTGVLVRVFDEKATDFEFLLARRDRNIDRNEKVYDDYTGKRVYDRFEAPDDDDDEDDEGIDDGYRKLSYAELIEPRILQQPLAGKETPNGITESGNADSGSAVSESIVRETVYDEVQSLQVDGESPGQSKLRDNENDDQLESVSGHERRGSDEPQAENNSRAAAVEDGIVTPRAKTDANINHLATEESTSQQSGPGQDAAALSVSSNRHREISLSIEEVGLGKDLSHSIMRRKTSSPSRQLLEMSGVLGTHRTASKSPLEMDAADDSASIAPGHDAIPPSSEHSVRSGRQPDLDFNLDMDGEDLPQINETIVGSPILGEPLSNTQDQTPTQNRQASNEPSSCDSLPSLDLIFLTATSQRNTLSDESPSKSQVLSELNSGKSAVPVDEEYEAAMRRIDNEEDDVEDEKAQDFGSTQKQLFPNSSQPAPERSPELPGIELGVDPISKTAPSSFNELENESKEIKPLSRTRKRKSSPFVIPTGSQVISLSSSRSNSPEEELREVYAEDAIDGDYQESSKSLPRGSGGVTEPRRISTRAKSMSAALAAVKPTDRRKSVPSSTAPAKSTAKPRGQRKSLPWS
ncbi:uncharacterized protein CTRU02_200805 [Colletotrichum truncatum]|uniref:Uncharacterized protein n=1 Tax=Colletotrichum truncatum TaxID=5467 RepID=A0ACC3ZFP8_COLTU|nr:uncharacterized protein CTRU02_00572 [Colletotrichum truncatum]KAF6801823.1 hypothetical protein CTRU02_00572 [Colletotrichum truncatum]